jgi:hypothetical protein
MLLILIMFLPLWDNFVDVFLFGTACKLGKYQLFAPYWKFSWQQFADRLLKLPKRDTSFFLKGLVLLLFLGWGQKFYPICEVKLRLTWNLFYNHQIRWVWSRSSETSATDLGSLHRVFAVLELYLCSFVSCTHSLWILACNTCAYSSGAFSFSWWACQ